MARRSSEASLKPNIIAFSYGKPTPGIVRALLLTAQDNHKNRQHHETGAYLFAAILALESYLEDLERNGKDAADQARTWRWYIPIKAPAAAAEDLAENSHNARPGAGAGELRNGNSICVCGHAKQAHDYDNGEACSGRDDLDDDCECEGYRPAELDAEALMCKCGHIRAYHTAVTLNGPGSCVGDVPGHFDICPCQCFQGV